MQHRLDPDNKIFINQVTDKCFDQIRDCKLDIEDFVNTMIVKIDNKDLEDLKECIDSFIELKDKELFHNAIEFVISEDTLFFKYINNYYNLAVDSQNLDDKYSLVEVYYNLVFMLSLPKEFDLLKSRQKEYMQRVYVKLFHKELDLNYSADYIVIYRSIIRNLFSSMEHESDSENLSAIIKEIVINKPIQDKIFKCFIDFKVSISKYEKYAPMIKSRMASSAIATSEEDLLVEINDSISANDAYVVLSKKTGEKYYVKNFSREVAWEKTLNPCEMYIYKVMEYIGYGPETHFLMDPERDVLWSCDAFENNFILTRDVVEEDGQKLFLDIKGNEGYFRKFAGNGSDRAVTKKFATELSAMVTLANLLPITDIFGKNGKNYGLVGNLEKTDEYSLQFVDHWPSANSFLGLLNMEKKNTYSPRAALLSMFFKDYNGCRKLSPLATLALESKDIHGITKDEIQDDVHRRIFAPQEGNIKSLGLEEAILAAREDIANLLLSEKEERRDEALAHLDQYISKINDATESYFSSLSKSSLKA